MKNSTFVLKKNDVPLVAAAAVAADGNFFEPPPPEKKEEKKIKVKFHSLDLIMSCRLCCRLNQMVRFDSRDPSSH